MAFCFPFLLLLLFFTIFVFSTVMLLFRLLDSKKRKCSSSHHYGPKTYPVLGCLISFYINRHRLLDWYTDLVSASPAQTIVMERLGARRTIVTSNPGNVEHMLKANFKNYPKGKPFTDLLGDLLGYGIFNADGELWHWQRKIASHEFTTRSLKEFVVNELEAEVDGRLIPVLAAASENGRVVDVQDLLRRLAFDNICKVVLGEDPGFLHPSLPESAFSSAFEAAAEISARRGAAPLSAVWRVKRAMGVGSEGRLKAEVELIHETVTGAIRRRREEIEKKMEHDDLLSRLISAGHDDHVVRDMVISFIMAGKDTTSAALTWFFWLLSCNPNAEEEAAAEAKKADKLNYEELKSMKVIEACLCESMRLYPPVLWDSKHAAGEDTLPDGTRVGKGDRVTYFQYGMGRMEALWGKDCMEFNPGRWLTAEGKEVVKVSPFKFAVFQAGPRVCLGKEMAFLQMKYVVAAVLRRFELRRVDERAAPPVLVPLLTAHMAGGLKMAVNERRWRL